MTPAIKSGEISLVSSGDDGADSPTGVTSIGLVDNASKRGRRVIDTIERSSHSRRSVRSIDGCDDDNSRRRDRKAIGQSLRNKNLLQKRCNRSQSSLSSSCTSFDCEDDASLSSVCSSSQSVSSSASSSRRRGRRHKSSRKANLVKEKSLLSVSSGSSMSGGDDSSASSLGDFISNMNGSIQFNTEVVLAEAESKKTRKPKSSAEKRGSERKHKSRKSQRHKEKRTSRDSNVEDTSSSSSDTDDDLVSDMQGSLQFNTEAIVADVEDKKKEKKIGNKERRKTDKKTPGKDKKKKESGEDDNQNDDHKKDNHKHDDHKKDDHKKDEHKKDEHKKKKKEKSKNSSKIPKAIKSCFRVKDNKKRSLFRDKKPEKVEKKVLFQSKSSDSIEKVRVIKPLFKYYNELWWTNEEIDECRARQSDFSSATEEEKAHAHAYMQCYRKGRQQMNYQRSVDDEVFEELVAGLKRGLGGIETHSNLHDTICMHIKETVQSIIEAHIMAKRSSKSKSSKKQVDTEILVKAHSEALTETDRHWAITVGKAEHEATLEA